MKIRAAAAGIPLLLFLIALSPLAFAAPAQEGAFPAPKSSMTPYDKAAELTQREKALREEEEHLLALRKEVDEKIAKYEKLLNDLVEREKKDKGEESARIDRLVKLFEGMPPEDAAARLGELGEDMASQILGRMKERKAGNILAAMDPKKSAAVVRRMAGDKKKFPAQ